MAQNELKLFTDLHLFDGMTSKQIAIIAAAIEVFAAKGYANSSTHEIAVKAGVAEGNIFSKFKNKAGLLQAIIAPVVDAIFPTQMNTFLAAQLEKEFPTLEDFIRSLVEDRVAFLRSHAQLLKIFLAEIIYNDEIRRQVINNLPKTYWQHVNEAVDAMKQKGLLVDWANQEIIRLMWSTLGGSFMSYLFFDQPLSAANVERLITGLTNSLKPQK